MNPNFYNTFLPAPRFQEVVQALEIDSAVCYVLDSNLDIAYTNPAWDKFAKDNDGVPLTAVKGTNIFNVIPRVLQPFYARAFDQVRSKSGIWQHIYECSGPQHFRKFRMRIHLLKANWLMVSNTLVVEQGLYRKPATSDFFYRNRNGMIVMCANCRSSQRSDDPREWNFCSAHLRVPAAFLGVHTALCPTCRGYFYPDEQVLTHSHARQR